MDHISVCVCTYKRQPFLKRLLGELGRQVTEGKFTYSIVIADNDHMQSGKEIVSAFASKSPITVTYCVEPRQNIALARNQAIENANGDYIAFLDDDEMPAETWLLTLLKTCQQYGVDGVLGSAKPEYEERPPRWVVKGKFYERATYATGFVIDWRKGRTGNLLLKRSVFTPGEPPFREDFLGGEDHDFFRRMIEKGRVFVWCNEAITHEIIPATRCRRWFMIRRALFRGKLSLLHPTSPALEVLKSVIAVPGYTFALPFLFLAGQHLFMHYLIKIFDHLGKLLAYAGIDPIKAKYVTQ
jgi:glycosyltransferase involved in cell wall biosynthesis